jgi:hypothetical protein
VARSPQVRRSLPPRSRHCLHTQDQWRARGETVAASAALTIISAGELYSLWNRDPCCDRPPLSRLWAIAYDLGYYPELGFSWSMHFDRIDP